MKKLSSIMKRIRYGFLSLSIRRKLLIMLLAISIVPTIILGQYAYSLSTQQVLQLKSAEAQYALKSMQASVQNTQYDKSIYALISVAQNADVMTLLDLEGKAWHEEEQTSLMMEVNKQLLFQSYDSSVNFIYLHGNNGFAFSSNEALPEIVDEVSESVEYQAFLQEPYLVLYGPVVDIKGKYYQTLVHKIFDGESKRITGYVFTWVSEETLSEEIAEIANDSLGDILLVDPRGVVVFSSQNYYWIGKKMSIVLPGIPQDRALQNEVLTVENDRMLVNSYVSANPNKGRYYCIIPYREVVTSSNHILIMTVGWTVIVCIVAVICAIALSNLFVNPIVKLSRLMKGAELGKIQTFTPKYRDEMGYIIQCYNDMATTLNEQNQLLEEGRKREKKLEMDAFEAQIKPHFLYNTLSNIIWLVERGRNEKASFLTHSLAEMFRIGVSRGASEIPLSKEIEHARHYMNIQLIRYEDEFGFEIDVDALLLDVIVIKMILQPLVENAIYHGMRQSEEGGLILLSGRAENGKLQLTVADSGGQMNAETRDMINRALARRSNEGTSLGLGILNVNERVKNAFGDAYGLHYEIDGQWTKAIIVLPLKRWGDL